MSIAIQGTISQYTYGTQRSLQPKLDKDDDGRWSKSELNNYAKAYNKATGESLDVDKLLEQYGDENGYIQADSQAQMRKDDALGLSKLSDAAGKVTTEGLQQQATPSLNLSDLMESMSESGKMGFARVVRQAESMSALLQGFGSGGQSSDGMFGLSSTLSQSNAAKLYQVQMRYAGASGASAMSNQLLNALA